MHCHFSVGCAIACPCGEMTVDNLTAIALIIFLALVLDVLTGILSAPSIVATMIASRAMSPRRALLWSTLAELIGPFLFGVAVANVIGSGVIDTARITPPVLYAALCASIAWMLLSWYLCIPSSSSHALIGGLVGSVFTALGPSAIQGSGFLKVVGSLTLTLPLGVLGGYLMVRLCYWLSKNSSPHINAQFNRGQLLASFGLGMAIGTNSAQHAMGIMALGLVMTGFAPHFEIPLWVIVASAVGLALGNLMGGMRLIRTIGARFFQIRPIHGFSAEAASATLIIVSSLLGGVVSTTHLTSLSVIGAGAAERVSMVRWGFVQNVLIAWVLTIPITAILGGSLYVLMRSLGVA
jgi:inorganic phosphate transporter, PiT family